MTLDDLLAARDALTKAMANPSSVIETPGLGRVEFKNTADIAGAIAAIDRQIAALGGQSGIGVQVIQSDRGLG